MKKIFNSKLVSIPKGSLMAEAKQLMTREKIRHLSIVNDENEIVSILSRHDISDADRFQDLPVDLFASFPVQFVTSDTPLSEVALIMLEKKISSVVLCDSHQNAIGIITSDNLLLQFSELAREIEKKKEGAFDQFQFMIGAGEFFKKLSDIGI